MPGYDDHMRDGWRGGMMGESGSTWSPWLVAFLVVTTLLVVLAAVVAVRLLRAGGRNPVHGSSATRVAEPPEEMLDRLFAAGEVDEATYRARRTALAEMRRPVQHQG